jgi:hypothetical protein
MVTFRVSIERASKITGIPQIMIAKLVENNHLDEAVDGNAINGTLDGNGYISTTNIESSPDGPKLVTNTGKEVTERMLFAIMLSGMIDRSKKIKEDMINVPDPTPHPFGVESLKFEYKD